MVDAVAHAGLRGQVDDDVEPVLFEQSVDKRLIADRPAHEHVPDRRCRSRLFEFLQPPFLQAHLVVIVHVVQADDRSAAKRGEKARHKAGADKARTSRDQDVFAV